MQDEKVLEHLLDIKDNMATKTDINTIHNRIDKHKTEVKESFDKVESKIDDASKCREETREHIIHIEEKQESNFKANEEAHKNILEKVDGHGSRIDATEAIVDGHQTELDQRQGGHKVVWWILGAVLALLSGIGAIMIDRLFFK